MREHLSFSLSPAQLTQPSRSFGSVAPILVLFLRELGYKDELVGSFISLSMLGDVVLSFALSWFADALGRRKLLGLSALLMCFSGVCISRSTLRSQG